MNQLYRRDSAGQESVTKKVKHFSYSQDLKIGKGYSSVVYRGTNDLTNQAVAIKAIDMKGVRDSASREMLDCQIQALTTLHHTNILKCFAVQREQSHCFIVTEYCNEGDLSAFLKKKRRLSEKQTLKLTKDIVSGFIQIADSGFLHRDLKLANIFLDSGRAVIADFGFAKKHMGKFEKQRYNVGSPLYMSPEALKKNIYTVKNDIWSIGIMVYELLHGETPWECRTERELIEKMIRVPVHFRDSLNLSPEIKAFIKKCLEVNEDCRMSLQDLREWNNKHSYKSLEEGGMSMAMEPTMRKPISWKQGQVGVLSEVTNRLASRSHSNINYPSNQSKDFSLKQNVPSSQASCQNVCFNSNSTGCRQSLTKNIVEKNNNILINEINTFRLLYKIYEKLRKYLKDQKELLNVVGNEVLRRVNNLMSVVAPEKENQSAMRGEDFGLTDIQKYLNEEVNSSIKKYRAVVKEYHKKYTQEITIRALGRQISSKNIMREALVKGNLIKQELCREEMVMVYWMIEFAQMKSDTKKEYLQGVIEPKGQNITLPYLQDRIKAL